MQSRPSRRAAARSEELRMPPGSTQPVPTTAIGSEVLSIILLSNCLLGMTKPPRLAGVGGAKRQTLPARAEGLLASVRAPQEPHSNPADRRKPLLSRQEPRETRAQRATVSS